jgi:hypothetical protein
MFAIIQQKGQYLGFDHLPTVDSGHKTGLSPLFTQTLGDASVGVHCNVCESKLRFLITIDWASDALGS